MADYTLQKKKIVNLKTKKKKRQRFKMKHRTKREFKN